MAKISARGDRERARWREPASGAELVLTQSGRLLYKWRAGAGFTLLGSGHDDESASAEAEARDMDRA